MEAIKKEDLQNNIYYKGMHVETDIALWDNVLNAFIYISKNEKEEYVLKQTTCFDIKNIDDVSFIPLFKLNKINTKVIENNKLEVVI